MSDRDLMVSLVGVAVTVIICVAFPAFIAASFFATCIGGLAVYGIITSNTTIL